MSGGAPRPPTDRYAPLAARVDALRAAGLERHLRVVEPVDATRALVDGRLCTLFCTNDYLGLASHPDVVAAYRGAGAGASRLISGNRRAHLDLEDALSERFGRPATLFGSGYAANLALFATVLQKGDVVASDALNHASIIDGIRLSRAERVVLPHGRPDEIPEDARLVVVEGIFSMDGDQVDLPRYVGRPWLAVDEAHAFGCTGPGGLGAAAARGVTPDFLVGTLGKALGVSGAFVVGPPELRALLLSAGRAFVYTTGVPEPVARAGLAALLLADDERRARLAENAARLRVGLWQIGVHVTGDAHIVPLLTGPRTMDVAERLLAAGFYAPGIRYPTVPRGQERIRATVSAAHTADQIDAFVSAVEAAIR